MTKKLSATDVANLMKPATTKCSLQLDAEIVNEIETLEAQLEKELQLDKDLNRTPVAPKLAEQILELTREAQERETEFVFKSIGRHKFSNLMLKHQDTEGSEILGADFPVNIDTLVPELLATSCVSPEGTTVDWWKDFYDQVSWGQAQTLVVTCIAAQVGSVETPKALRASIVAERFKEN